MKQIIRHISIVLIYFLLFSCEKAVDWDLPKTFDSVLVVDGGITSEFKKHEISLNFSFNEINGTPEPVSGAEVIVYSDTTPYIFEEDSVKSGYYYSAPFAAELNKKYRLSIKMNDKYFYAIEEITPVNDFAPASYSKKSEEDSLYYIIPEFNNIGNNDQEAVWEIIVSWPDTFNYKTRHGKYEARQLFYTLNTLDIPEVFKPEKEVVYFPAFSKIIQKKYSVSDGYSNYLRALLFETEWTGGFFDAEHANLPTNINGNHAVGYFWVSAVSTDTIIAYPF